MTKKNVQLESDKQFKKQKEKKVTKNLRKKKVTNKITKGGIVINVRTRCGSRRFWTLVDL